MSNDDGMPDEFSREAERFKRMLDQECQEHTRTMHDRNRMRTLLRELDAYFDDRADIMDGIDGEPMANEAMRWQMEIAEVLGKSK